VRRRSEVGTAARRAVARWSRRVGWGLLVVAVGCAGGRPGLIQGDDWEIAFQSSAPDDPEADSLYLELLDSDGLEEGFVDVAVQLHRMRPRLVRATGTVAYRSAAGAAGEPGGDGGLPVAFLEWEEGWYFERCRNDVAYDVEVRRDRGEVRYEVGVEPMGLVGRLLTGSCEGARDTGRLLVLRFELQRPGTVAFDVDPEGRTAFDATAGDRMSYGRTYGGTLTIRRAR